MIGGVDKTGGGKIEKWQITFNLIPAEATLVVKDLAGQIIQPIQANNIYELETGIYTYTVTADKYISQEDVRLEVYKETIIDVQLQKELKIVPFADATDEQLEKMLNAHYNGEIDLSTIWKVGDARKIHINEIPSGENAVESHVAQDIVFVILDFNHDDLLTQQGIRTKAAVTIQGRGTFLENGYYWGIAYNTDETSNYRKNPRRTWFNNDFINALPQTFSPLIKTVMKKNLYNHKISSSSITTEDKAFFVSCSEVFGDGQVDLYAGNTKLEGEQYEYYKTDYNRIKTSKTWWLRSPSYNYHSVLNYMWFGINGSGDYQYFEANISNGICPAFCI